MSNCEKLMIIDGNSIINRAFYGIRPLTTKEGIATNAIYGFMNILYKYLADYEPEYICVAFDLPKLTFRHLKYDGYKAQRKKMPDELAQQMPILKDVLAAMNICILEKEGFEADDIIGTVSVMCEKEDKDCYIVTGDRDDLQLATKHVQICLTTTAKGQTVTTVYNDDAVFSKYGVMPHDLIEVKALQGDSSDNIPGVPGIGEKGALDLVKTYHNLENIYENLNEKDFKPAMFRKLTEGRDLAYLSRELGTIDVNVPLEFTLDDAKKQEENKEELLAIFHKLEFRGLAKKLEQSDDSLSNSDELQKKPTIVLKSAEEFSPLLAKCDKLYYKMFYQNDNLIGFAMSLAENVYFMAVSDKNEQALLDTLAPFMVREDLPKISHDMKADFIYLYAHGVALRGISFDTMLASYILEPSFSDYSIANIAREFLSLSMEDYAAVLAGVQTQMSLLEEVHNDALISYSEKVMRAILLLADYETETMTAQGQMKLYTDIELPLMDVLADMQIEGVLVDKESLKEFSAMLDEQITNLTQQIYEMAGQEFNINSSKQLGEILFDKMGLPVIKKTKTGYSTNVDVLEKLYEKHPIIPSIMEYRKDAKLKSTYCDGLLSVIGSDGRIHSKFNQTVTVTGRISSTEPNMQNIPVRTALGREMRRMFVARPGYLLIDADYSQIELRVLAHIADDQTMIDGFKNGVDIHALTASQVFDTPLDSVTSKMRSAAKSVNFGIVYGIGEYSLSQDIHVSVKEAKHYIDHYLQKYSGVRTYMETIKETAKAQGYVETMFGRRRYIPEMNAKNHNIRAFGERVALNTPIQGTAADIIKIAMVRVQNRLEKECEKARLILQVHDELIIEAPENEVELASIILKEEMEHAADLKVDLFVDLKSGHSWYDTK